MGRDGKGAVRFDPVVTRGAARQRAAEEDEIRRKFFELEEKHQAAAETERKRSASELEAKYRATHEQNK